MSALSQIHADHSMAEARQGVSSRDFGRSLSAPPALWDAPEHKNAPFAAHDTRGSARGIRQGVRNIALLSCGRDAGGQTEARVRVSAPHSPIRPCGGHRVSLSAFLWRGGHGAGAPVAREFGGRSLAASGASLHSAGSAPLARATAPIALAAVHALRGTAPTPRQEAFPWSAEGGPNSVEEKTPAMSETTEPPLILRSPANPDGWDLRDLLDRIRAELAAQNVALRERGGDFDRAELRAGQEAVRFLAYADAPASELASLRVLREMATAERGAERRAA